MNIWYVMISIHTTINIVYLESAIGFYLRYAIDLLSLNELAFRIIYVTWDFHLLLSNFNYHDFLTPKVLIIKVHLSVLHLSLPLVDEYFESLVLIWFSWDRVT